MVSILILRYDKIISFQERESNRNFTGCQMPHFMFVLRNNIYQFIKPFLANKLSVYEEYGTFKGFLVFMCYETLIKK